jgi:cysteine-rich repeat protein
MNNTGIISILGVAAMAAVSCVETRTSTCASGWRCPSGQLCVEQMSGPVCAIEGDVLACAGKGEAQPCIHPDGTDLARCREGVCTPIGCGNGHIEMNEVCDDGNREDADGCSHDCLVQCGDGMVQSNEACDPRAAPRTSCLDHGFDMGMITCYESCQSENTEQCSYLDWEPMALPVDWHLARVWVLSAEEAFATGTRGVIPDTDEAALCSSCGGIFRYDGTSWALEKGDTRLLVDLWANDAEDIYAVGLHGGIWHYDGDTWTSMAVDPAYHLVAIWGTGPQDIYAVGSHVPNIFRLEAGRFAVLHYDGRTWTPMDLSQAPDRPHWNWRGLYSVWSSGPGDVFAVGSHGVILRYDGNPEGVWKPMDLPPTSDGLREERKIFDVWGMHANDVFAVGQGGLILHHDGEGWTRMSPPIAHNLGGIWGNERGQIFAVGEEGTLLGYDPLVEDGWLMLESHTSSDLTGIHGDSAGNILAVGIRGAALQRRQTGWMAMDVQGNQRLVHRIWGLSLDCLHAVDEGGRIWHYDGNADWRWSPSYVPATNIPLLDIHGLGCDRDVFAVGSAGSILRLVDGAWIPMQVPGSYTMSGVWAAAPDDVFAVSREGAILHYDGNEEARWALMRSGVESVLRSVWGASAQEVFASGTDGKILRYDGNLQESWQRMDDTTNWMFYDVWGSGPNDVFAVGEAMTILRYDGTAWRRMPGIDLLGALHAVWGRSAGDVFAAGNAGDLLHYDGVQWSEIRSPTAFSIETIWGTPGGEHLLIADEAGHIFRMMRPTTTTQAAD